MALPKIHHTLYTHRLVGLGKEVKFRAFTNAEQKTLLQAKEAKGSEDEKTVILGAVEQIVSACTLGKLDARTLSTFDIEDLFLRIRAKSVGEVVTVKYSYDYQDEQDRKRTNFIEVNVNLDDVKVVVPEGHTNTIQLTQDIGMVMRYPTFSMMDKVKDSEDVAIACIESIFDKDEVYHSGSVTEDELRAFYADIDAQGTMKIKQFFDTMPRLRHQVEVQLHDGTTETVTFEGLEDFFT